MDAFEFSKDAEALEVAYMEAGTWNAWQHLIPVLLNRLPEGTTPTQFVEIADIVTRRISEIAQQKFFTLVLFDALGIDTGFTHEELVMHYGILSAQLDDAARGLDNIQRINTVLMDALGLS